eukprot:g1477.t1
MTADAAYKQVQAVEASFAKRRGDGLGGRAAAAFRNATKLDVIDEDDAGRTMLMRAVSHSDMVLVSHLVACGVDVDIRDKAGKSAVWLASERGIAEAVKLLLEGGGAEVNEVDSEYGCTPLFLAAQEGHGEIVKLLVGAGAKVDLATTDVGMTPLYIAAYQEHGEIVKLLLGAGAKVDLATTDDGSTPLIVAAQEGLGEIVKLLVGAGAKVDLATTDGCTPLYIAAEQGHGEIVKLLVGAGAKLDLARTDNGSTPLFVAAQKGHGEIVKLLVGAGAKLDLARTDDGSTPLIVAAQEGLGEIVKLLVGAGAKVDLATTDIGATPLYTAAGNGRGEIVKLLVGAGAKLDLARTDVGCTPLYIAAEQGHGEIVKLLVGAGAKVDLATTDIGATPLFTAAEYGHGEIVKLLVGAGAKVDLATTDDGTTPLYTAAFQGHGGIVKLLVGAGAKVDLATTDIGSTPLSAAAQYRHGDVVKELITAGAAVNTFMSTNNFTPLMYAALNGEAGIAAALIAAGADVTVQSTAVFRDHPAGVTAIDIAQGLGHNWGDAFWRGDFEEFSSTIVMRMSVAEQLLPYHASQSLGVAFRALTECNDDLERATKWLLSGQADAVIAQEGGIVALEAAMFALKDDSSGGGGGSSNGAPAAQDEKEKAPRSPPAASMSATAKRYAEPLQLPPRRRVRVVHVLPENDLFFRRKMEAHQELTRSTNLAHDVGDVVRCIGDTARRFLEAELLTIFVADPDRKELVCKSAVDSSMVGRRIPWKSGIVGHCRSTGRVVNGHRADDDLCFGQHVRQGSILCVPVVDHQDNGRVVAVIEAINKKPSQYKAPHFSDDDSDLLQYIATHAAIVMRKSQLYSDAKKAKRVADAMLSVVKASSSADSIMTLVQRILDAAYDILSCARISLLLVDNVKHELWVAFSKDMAGERIPFGKGIAGHVALCGETINVADARTSARFDMTMDAKSGFITHSLLCMPVWSPGGLGGQGHGRRRPMPIAVIQAVNKGDNGCEIFTKQDEEALSALSAEVGNVLKRRSMEVVMAKLMEDLHTKKEDPQNVLDAENAELDDESLEASLLAHYSDMKDVHIMKKKGRRGAQNGETAQEAGGDAGHGDGKSNRGPGFPLDSDAGIPVAVAGLGFLGLATLMMIYMRK